MTFYNLDTLNLKMHLIPMTTNFRGTQNSKFGWKYGENKTKYKQREIKREPKDR